MESEGIVKFFEDKTILVTGATGFLAKVLVEKILRTQPNVRKLFLLLRARDGKSASQRFHDEVTGKELFRVLKQKWGGNFSSLVSEKVFPVAGDISGDHLGIKDSKLREEMWRDIDIIVSSAATTKFNERYDVALGINALGALHVLKFAKKCAKIKLLLHVSTAYVCGEREGLIREKPIHMGETLNGASGLDIDAENKMVDERLEELRGKDATQNEITLAMKDLGTQRAKLFGWPNTYVSTKAMGEMILWHLKGNLPLVIIRPSIITSTYKEPFPCWIEGLRTTDTFIASYGKGKMTTFVGDLGTIIDCIPCDMVVNSMIVAMVAHANQPSSEIIYHLCSSQRNPLLYANIMDFGLRYFTKNPWIDNKHGKPVKVGKLKSLSTMKSFHSYMSIRYLLLLKVLQILNALLCHCLEETCNNLNRKIKSAIRLVQLYKPYLFFKAIFEDINTEKLRMAAQESGMEVDDGFCFDPRNIDWEDYFMNTHIPGVVKYLF